MARIRWRGYVGEDMMEGQDVGDKIEGIRWKGKMAGIRGVNKIWRDKMAGIRRPIRWRE